MNVFGRWIGRRWLRRRRREAEARKLIKQDGAWAYYAAHRFRACAEAEGNRARGRHWRKVAAEVARQSPAVERDPVVVQRITAEASRSSS